MRKRITIVSLCFVFLAVLAYLCFWAYKYYCFELPDNQTNKSLQERAEAAKEIAHRRGLSKEYCILVDYSIPSGSPRLFVWSFSYNRIVFSCHVMHGPGKGSTAELPVFSNVPGSKCSSLGKFIVTKDHGNKLKRSYRISGLEFANRTAYTRGLMIHRSRWVDINCWRKYIPLHKPSCQGCLTVSSRGMNYLESLIKNQKKQILLWSFYNMSQ